MSGENKRVLSRYPHFAVKTVAAGLVAFQMLSMMMYPIDPWIMRAVHLGFLSVVAFLMIPSCRISPLHRFSLVDVLISIAAIMPIFYIIANMKPFLDRYGVAPTQLDVIVATITILLIIEVVRRTTGYGLTILMIIFLVYGMVGPWMPGVFWHRGYSWPRISTYLLSTEGIYSIPLGVSATYVTLFVGFGCFNQLTGLGEFFNSLANSLAGWARGGSGKASIVSSALFGTISGSSVANVVVDGWLTIPLMKRTGFKPHFAGAVEAVASTGGQIMPPVMGAAAFVMADILGISYGSICVAAVIPAIMYYIAFFMMLDFEAARTGLKGLPREQLPSLRKLLLNQGHLLIPVGVMIYTLVIMETSTIRAGLLSIFSVIILSWLKKSTRLGPRGIFNALQMTGNQMLSIAATCAGAGVILGVISLTGIGGKLAMMVFNLSQGNLLIALILTMIITLILGMGLPTVAAYIVCASVVAPGLTEMGVERLAAHMFIFYFACISAITPPVALASYAAAAIADASLWAVGLSAVRIAFTAYVIPYMFVFGPPLLAKGGFVEIMWAIITACIGVTCIAGGIQGWLLKRATVLERIALLAGGFPLVYPGVITDTIGLSLVMVVLASQLAERSMLLKPFAFLMGRHIVSVPIRDVSPGEKLR
ncbi:MAG: TRAP transporter permease [Deltaproteobacteria bacterium]|nr:TRAP transporter permease [Deltaproteobacteria bacterium]